MFKVIKNLYYQNNKMLHWLDLKLKKFKIKRILTYIYPFTKSLNNRKLDL